ncbi:nucleotide-sugar transporter [Backusella circina FSU 941]|nr:nucleotide-sugar transporter [Backusella circina FSU 941]
MSHYYPIRRSFKKQELPFSSNSEKKKDNDTIYGISLKYLSLIILIVQNSLLVLLMRYSRTIKGEHDPIYLASTAVLIVELVKLPISFTMLYVDSNTTWNKCFQAVQLQTIHKPKEVLKMLVPSVLYALQNNLLYIALSNLEAATFQVTYQLKILSTALFSVWLLGKSLDRGKWLALLLLMVGVTLVQMESTTVRPSSLDQQHQSPFLGLFAVLLCCISSGFAGCYFEKLLKTSTTSMWIRNIQLGLCGTLFSLIGIVLSDADKVWRDGFFQGYNGWTVLVIINQALGGLLVSIVVKYADNILKGFATSLSIVLSSVISFYLLDFEPSYMFLAGTSIVMSATVLYGRQ